MGREGKGPLEAHNPKAIIIIIKIHKRGEMEIKEGPLKHVRADKVQNEERR